MKTLGMFGKSVGLLFLLLVRRVRQNLKSGYVTALSDQLTDKSLATHQRKSIGLTDSESKTQE